MARKKRVGFPPPGLGGAQQGFGFPAPPAAGGGLTAPTTRRPTRAALGGAVPRGGRMRISPALGAAGARGATAAKAKKATSTRRKKTA